MKWFLYLVLKSFVRVVHAAVADLDGVSVADFSKLMIFG